MMECNRTAVHRSCAEPLRDDGSAPRFSGALSMNASIDKLLNVPFEKVDQLGFRLAYSFLVLT